ALLRLCICYKFCTFTLARLPLGYRCRYGDHRPIARIAPVRSRLSNQQACSHLLSVCGDNLHVNPSSPIHYGALPAFGIAQYGSSSFLGRRHFQMSITLASVIAECSIAASLAATSILPQPTLELE